MGQLVATDEVDWGEGEEGKMETSYNTNGGHDAGE